MNHTISPLALVDVTGTTIHVPDPHQWTLFGLMRSAGCPVCTLRYHELAARRGEMERAGLQAPMVFASSSEDLAVALLDSSPVMPIIADPDQQLHQRFAVRRSTRALVRGLAHGLLDKERRGRQLQASGAPSDSTSPTQQGADLLIDTSGTVVVAHHWRWPGDHLPVDVALQRISSP